MSQYSWFTVYDFTLPLCLYKSCVSLPLSIYVLIKIGNKPSVFRHSSFPFSGSPRFPCPVCHRQFSGFMFTSNI